MLPRFTRQVLETFIFVKPVGPTGAISWAQLARFGDEHRFRFFHSYWF